MIELWKALGQPARTQFAIALLLSALSGAAGVSLLGLSGWFLTAAALAGLSGAGYIFNHLYPSAGVRFAAFARVLTRYGEQLVGHDATLSLSARLRPAIFASSAHARRGFSSLSGGELSAMVDDVDAAERGFLRVLSPAAAVLASLLVALGFTLAADPWIALLAVAAAILFGAVLPLQAVRRSHRAADAHAGQTELVRRQVARLVENAVELDIAGALASETDRTRGLLQAHLEAGDRIEQPFRWLAAFGSTVGLTLALLLLWRASTASLDLPLAVGAGLALIAAFDAASTMVKVFDAAPRARLAADRLRTRLTTEDAPWDVPAETAAPLPGVFPLIATDLTAQAAPEAAQIGPVSFTLDAGQVLELIGPSGVGKTTLAETLMRLHPLTGGRVTYAGHAAGTVRIASVLEHIALSPQLPAFLPGSLADQLRLAAPQASDAELWDALDLAQAGDFVRATPDGLNTLFSNGEAPFSGGELRRIGLARALLAEPQILILDEPFAGLDTALQQTLADALAGWLKATPRALILLGHKPADMPALPANQIIHIQPA